jgi:subtilisin family serine protease
MISTKHPHVWTFRKRLTYIVTTTCLLANHVHSLGDTSSALLQSLTPSFDIMNSMLATSFAEQALTDSAVLEIASFEWSVMDDTTVSPFIVCANEGRVGTESLFRNWNVRDSEVLWSRGKLTCYIAYMTAVNAVQLTTTVPQLAYLTPMSGLYQVEKGLLSQTATAGLFLNPVECSQGIQFIVSPNFSSVEEDVQSLTTKIAEELQSPSTLKRILQDRFYWTATKGLPSQEVTPTSRLWSQAIDNVMKESSICDFTQMRIKSEYSIFTLSDLCHLATSAEASTDCMLALFAYLSTVPEVSEIENVWQIEATNINAARIVQSGNNTARPYPLWTAGINGTGQKIQVYDTGFDYNNCYLKNSNGVAPPISYIGTSCQSAAAANETLSKTVMYTLYGAATVAVDKNGHGTHVAGTTSGYNAGSTPGVSTQSGMAPGSKLYVFGLNTQTGSLSGVGNYSSVFICVYNKGVRVTTASIAIMNLYTYHSSSLSIDQYLYRNDEYMYYGSAGNDGGSGVKTASVLAPNNNKNGICSGASQNWLMNTAANMTRVASFSSIGPAPQGRIKPDLLTPGMLVNSANVNTTCGVTSKQGTSMSCPALSGLSLLVRQYYMDGFYPTGTKIPGNAIPSPSGSLIKATLVTSAVGARQYQGGSGNYALPPPPNIWGGWGVVQLQRVLRLNNSPYPILYVKDRVSISEDSVITYKFSIPSSSTVMSSFEITIVWTDPPTSTASGGAVVNNLDITATLDSDSRKKTIFPNNMMSADIVNNVEKIWIPNPVKGDVITVKVRGTNVAVTATQNYSLVAAGVYVPAAWYCQDPRSIRPNALYTTNNCRIPCQTFKKNPICCAADAGDFCTTGQASDSHCVGLTKPSNC